MGLASGWGLRSLQSNDTLVDRWVPFPQGSISELISLLRTSYLFRESLKAALICKEDKSVIRSRITQCNTSIYVLLVWVLKKATFWSCAGFLIHPDFFNSIMSHSLGAPSTRDYMAFGYIVTVDCFGCKSKSDTREGLGVAWKWSRTLYTLIKHFFLSCLYATSGDLS